MGAKAYTINKGNCKPADRNGTLEKATKIYTNLVGHLKGVLHGKQQRKAIGSPAKVYRHSKQDYQRLPQFRRQHQNHIL